MIGTVEISLNVGDKLSMDGRRMRTCIVDYKVNGIGSKTLYSIKRCTTKDSMEEVDVATLDGFNFPDEIDHRIAKAIQEAYDKIQKP